MTWKPSTFIDVEIRRPVKGNGWDGDTEGMKSLVLALMALALMEWYVRRR